MPTSPRLRPAALLPEERPPTISLVLIDDNRLTRAGLVALLRRQPGYRVQATSAVIAKALRTVRDGKPDLVALNMGHADDDALTLAGALHGETPGSRIVVMGLDAGHVDVESLVRAGVAGFVMSNAGLRDFLDTVQRVARNEQVLPPALAGALFGQLKRHGTHWRRKVVTGTGRLTIRERQVADLIVRGLSNGVIADRLAITLHTVKSHVHRVLGKLECNTRLEIAAFAQRGSHHAPGPPLAARGEAAAQARRLARSAAPGPDAIATTRTPSTPASPKA